MAKPPKPGPTEKDGASPTGDPLAKLIEDFSDEVEPLEAPPTPEDSSEPTPTKPENPKPASS